MESLLSELVSRCKAGVYVSVNGHKDIYITVDSYLCDEASVPSGMVNEAIEKLDISYCVYEKMIELDTIVMAQFYPHTPIGFYTVYGADVDGVLRKCLDILD